MSVLTVRHITTYRYKQPVAFGEHRMMLRPRDSYDQKLLDAQARDHPGAGRHPLGARRVRQLRRDRPVRRAGAGAALREHHPPRPFADQRASISRSRNTRRDTRSPTAPRRCPICCARSSGNISIPSTRSTAGRGSSCAMTGGPTPRELLAAMTHAIKQRLDLCRARGERHPGPGQDLAAGQRQLPRFRGADDGGGALARARGAFRLAATSMFPRTRPRRAGRRRRHPCLAAGLSAGRRLGRVRSDQRHRRQATT